MQEHSWLLDLGLDNNTARKGNLPSVPVSIVNLMLGLHFPISTCGTCNQPHVLLKLYIHLVRPHIEFACQVWSPHQQFLINTIERVQRRATKLIITDRSLEAESSFLGLEETFYGLSFPF